MGRPIPAGKLSATVSVPTAAIPVCTYAISQSTQLWWSGVFSADAASSALSVLPGSVRGTRSKLEALTLTVARYPPKTRSHQVTSKSDHGAGFCYDRPIKEFILKNQTDIDSLADTILEMLIEYGKKVGGPLVITLQGELGAGKTTFMKSLARKLGISESIASPTFVILKKYAISKQEFLFHNLIHIDAYRLENGAELEKIGFGKFTQSDQRNLICIEWPEIVVDILLVRGIAIKFEHLRSENHTDDSEMRKVTVEHKM